MSQNGPSTGIVLLFFSKEFRAVINSEPVPVQSILELSTAVSASQKTVNIAYNISSLPK